MTMLIVYHGEAGPAQRRRFAEVEAQHGWRIEVVAPGDDRHLESVLGEMTLWWHVLTPITDEHLARAPRLRLIHKWGVGLNTIDLDSAAKRGVAVANMPGSNASAVAEHATLLTLAVLRRLPRYHERTSAGAGWPIDAALGEGCHELSGSVVGLIGYGAIAQRFAQILEGFGATVYHHSRRDDRAGWRPLEDLLAHADIVSLHVPLDADTERLLDVRRIARMKPSAVLINTARGGLVDLAALDAALARGDLAGAGLDTFDPEPWDATPSIARHPGVVVTPHIAWLTWETLERSLDLGVAAALAVRDGTDIANRVV